MTDVGYSFTKVVIQPAVAVVPSKSLASNDTGGLDMSITLA